MKVYTGKRTDNGAVVKVNGAAELPLRLDLRNHSPTGFEWGYGGSGPAQLSLALCAHVVGDERAQRVYQKFKFRHVAGINTNEWTLDEETIRRAIEEIEKESEAAAS